MKIKLKLLWWEKEVLTLKIFCKTAGLTRKTEKAIPAEELVTEKVLLLLNQDDINMLSLPLGQHKLLSVAIVTLKQCQGKNSSDGPNTPILAPTAGTSSQGERVTVTSESLPVQRPEKDSANTLDDILQALIASIME